MIRMYHNVDPSVLTDEKWAQSINEIEFCLKYQADFLAAAVVKTLAPLLRG